MLAAFFEIAPGSAGTRDTLHHMRMLVRASIGLPEIRLTAAEIVRPADGRDSELQAALIRQFLDERVRFLRDPRGLELLHAPSFLLTEIASRGYVLADCDDVAILGAALGMAVGLRARLVALGRRGVGFEHVFTVLGDPSGSAWWELDTTRPFQDVPPDLYANDLQVEV